MGPHDNRVIKMWHFQNQNWGADLEAARLALCIGEVKFEDKRIPRAGSEWDELKASGFCPFDQLPVLEMDGVVISQSNAINRLVGRVSGLWPADARSAAKTDEILCAIMDIKQRFFPSMIQSNPQRKVEMRTRWVEVILPDWLSNVETLLTKNSAPGFSVGQELTMADLML